VNKLGKIYDALEKSKVKQTASVRFDKTPDRTVNDRAYKSNEPKKPISIFSDVNAPDVSNKTLKAVEGLERTKRTASFVKTDILYDENYIDENMVALLKPQSFEAEQFKILRTNLLFPSSGKSPRTIMVASAMPDEGKSLISANLAISIAQSIQEHVLLIDCDIRRPCIHTQFGFGDVPGLSEHLSKGIPLSSLLLKTTVDKLSILPGGRPPLNPSELVSSQQMTKLLQEVKYRYSDRFIVIDSPPPKLSAEASALSRQVDGVLLVIEYGRTSREMVSDLINIIGKEKIIGVVLNKLDMRFASYYGLGKYKTYSKYYQKY
jgi:exopolysaccharide/PEP-CTERM locus tyrosine autokinase